MTHVLDIRSLDARDWQDALVLLDYQVPHLAQADDLRVVIARRNGRERLRVQDISPLLPNAVRWGSWVKPFGSFKPGISPAYVWEPVAFYAPNRPVHDRGRPTIRDFLIEEGPAIRESIALKRGLVGAKPPKFCAWILDILGFDAATDTLVDLFPGTGVMGRVVEDRRAQNNNEPLRLLP